MKHTRYFRRVLIFIFLVCICGISACGKEKTPEEQQDNREEAGITGQELPPSGEVPSVTNAAAGGDASETENQYEYEYTTRNPRIEEKDQIFLTSLYHAVIYRGEYATYYFDESLSPEDRDRFISTSEQVVSFLAKHIALDHPLEVYAADHTYFYNSETGKCSLGSEYAGTSVQAALILQAAIGSPTVNFGLLQAMGFCMAEQFGWDTSYVPPIPMTNNKDLSQPLAGTWYEIKGNHRGYHSLLAEQILTGQDAENRFLLDLEYLCFSPNYVGEEQLEGVWCMVKSLSDYITERKKESDVLRLLECCDDLLAFEEGFTELRNEWLGEYGSVRLHAQEYPVQYGSYGRFELFQMKTLHGRWYVLGDFDSSYPEDTDYSWLFRRDYQETSRWMRSLERELAYADEVLKKPGYDYPEAVFCLSRKNEKLGAAGYFTPGGRDIQITMLFSVVHEYCHYLMLQEGVFLDHGISKEAYETQLHLLPHYYGSFSEIRYLFMQYMYEDRKKNDDEEIQRLTKILEDKFDGNVLICDRESIICFQHFDAAVTGKKIPLAKIITGKAVVNGMDWENIMASFSFYIADTYGEDVLYLVATGNDRVEELTGHTFEGLAEEWEEYLKENYPV